MSSAVIFVCLLWVSYLAVSEHESKMNLTAELAKYKTQVHNCSNVKDKRDL